MRGERRGFRWIRLIVGHAIERKLATGLNHGFRARGIALAGELNENFVIATSGESDGRLGEAERIDAARNRLERLVHGVVTQGSHDRRLHVQLVTVHLAGGGRHAPIRKLVGDQVAERCRIGGVHIKDQYLRVAGPADFTDDDVFLVQLLVELVHRLIAALPDGFVHLNLQNEMAAAFEIETQFDAVGEVILQLRTGCWETGHPDDTENAKKNDKDNKDELPFELRIHASRLILLRFGLESRDGAARDLDLDLFCDAQLDRVVFEPHDGAIDAAVRDYLIARFQFIEHLGDLLLAALSRHDHQKIKDDHNENQGKEKRKAAGLTRCLG